MGSSLGSAPNAASKPFLELSFGTLVFHDENPTDPISSLVRAFDSLVLHDQKTPTSSLFQCFYEQFE